MAKYLYGGAAQTQGRFGAVAPGDQLDLTDAEAANLPSSFLKIPTAYRDKLYQVNSYTVLQADHAKLLLTKQAGAINITLPAAPATPFFIEIQHGETAGAFNVTVLRNGATIDGAAADFVITPTIGRKGFMYNGNGNWISF